MAMSAAVKTEITKQAEANRLTPRNLIAVVDVESAGVPMWKVGGKDVPPVRPEAHHFYKRLSGEKRKRAIALGLAHPKAGVVKVPGSRAGVYDVIKRMIAIDSAAAYESCSWGVGQVMGFHWKKLAYASPEALASACYTLAGSVDCMVREIRASSLINKLNAGNGTSASWKPFALGYNGPLGVKWGYHTKMANAWLRASGVADVRAVAVAEQIEDIQSRLKKAGYYKGSVDGISGPKTVAAIKQFQKDQGLVADGKYGTMTRDALDEFLAGIDKVTGDKATGGGAATIAVGGVGETIVEQVGNLQMTTGGTSKILDIAFAVLIVIGVGLVAFGLYRRFRASSNVLQVET